MYPRLKSILPSEILGVNALPKFLSQEPALRKSFGIQADLLQKRCKGQLGDGDIACLLGDPVWALLQVFVEKGIFPPGTNFHSYQFPVNTTKP